MWEGRSLINICFECEELGRKMCEVSSRIMRWKLHLSTSPLEMTDLDDQKAQEIRKVSDTLYQTKRKEKKDEQGGEGNTKPHMSIMHR
jgi:hypothetical protein